MTTATCHRLFTTSFLVIGLVGMIGWPFGIRSALAQEASPEPEQTQSPSPTDQDVVAARNQEINDQVVTYRSLLETYQTVEKEYVVAKGQFAQVGTLAALEAGIQSTRKAMVARNAVLSAYFKLLTLQVQYAAGLSESEQSQALEALAEQSQTLAAYDQRVSELKTRLELNALADEYTQLESDFQDSTYYALSVLALGRLQQVHDQASAIATETKASLSTDETSLDQARRERAMTEVERVLAQTSETLQETRTRNADPKTQHSRSTYQAVLKNMGSVYTGLNQVLSYLQELNQEIVPAP